MVCEMGFLQRFSRDQPATWAAMKKYNPRYFSIVGGGITSPDNLLPHGEALFHNYLTGLLFLQAEGVEWSKTVWLPDDFGHDSQLPVTLVALGANAVSFARIPGACNQGGNFVPTGARSAYEVLLDETNGGLSFEWGAADSSSIFTYFMPTHYSCGDSFNHVPTHIPNSPTSAAQCQSPKTCNDNSCQLQAFIDVRAPLSVAPVYFVPFGDDFGMPVLGLLESLEVWNTEHYPKTGVYAVASQFDVFVGLMADHLQGHPHLLPHRSFHGSTPKTSFKPTPYWTGFYSSRPQLKYNHYTGTRLLLGVETLDLLLESLTLPALEPGQLEAVWSDLAPSTHHDYITGTAVDYVVENEQYPLGEKVLAGAAKLQATLLSSLEMATDGFVFNQNGFALPQTLVQVAPSSPLFHHPLAQRNPDGALVFLADVPAFGYSVVTKKSLVAAPLAPVKLQTSPSKLVLSNQYLSATASSAANWSLTSLVDLATKQSVLSQGNLVEFRHDQGNIYRYGFEEGCGFDPYTVKVLTYAPIVVEQGDLRAKVQMQLEVSDPSGSFSTRNYTLTYSLSATEAFLRMSLEGVALPSSSVLTSFSFAESISHYTHGTPTHWDRKEPFAFGRQSDFLVTMEATHDFLIPESAGGDLLAAIYHPASPSWGVIDQSLYGVLLRDSPGGAGCPGYGADGTDQASHLINYAIRVPSGLTSPSTGMPQREARAYHTPLLVATGHAGPSTHYSLAKVTGNDMVFLTAAKRGSFDPTQAVFRIYNPTNKNVSVSITFPKSLLNATTRVSLATALERPLKTLTSVHEHTLTISLANAVTTVMLENSK
eukprot:TRINITY_DN4291_c0_g1_i1.p1 TRINITY_DN4291_c0_g1~~TRINITY_DN4291_c0_g1_i1.p1  ORF type:complete len:821 (+),score=113.42 TRINITY_DN4291_c0_g1_i1:743-3205(+)